MRNLIVSYKKLPTTIQKALESMYPEGYEDDTFEFEMPGKQTICKAIRVTLEGVNYLIKLDQRPKMTDYLMDDEW
ncbi:MAG TPA: hypothetical protein DCX00_01865 [Flavobacteriales bacterium]|nr:hypothetical protein [Flavobacteriales bacterium]HAW72549.1 hypothetical protein [Flavobacteriales bacterium]